jgi:hypothetical protein
VLSIERPVRLLIAILTGVSVPSIRSERASSWPELARLLFVVGLVMTATVMISPVNAHAAFYGTSLFVRASHGSLEIKSTKMGHRALSGPHIRLASACQEFRQHFQSTFKCDISVARSFRR